MDQRGESEAELTRAFLPDPQGQPRASRPFLFPCPSPEALSGPATPGTPFRSPAPHPLQVKFWPPSGASLFLPAPAKALSCSGQRGCTQQPVCVVGEVGLAHRAEGPAACIYSCSVALSPHSGMRLPAHRVLIASLQLSHLAEEGSGEDQGQPVPLGLEATGRRVWGPFAQSCSSSQSWEAPGRWGQGWHWGRSDGAGGDRVGEGGERKMVSDVPSLESALTLMLTPNDTLDSSSILDQFLTPLPNPTWNTHLPRNPRSPQNSPPGATVRCVPEF